MQIYPDCAAYKNDEAYYKAFTGADDLEINRACACLYNKYGDCERIVLVHLNLSPDDEKNIEYIKDGFQEALVAVICKIQAGRFILGKAKIFSYIVSVCKYQVLAALKRKQVLERFEEVTPLKINTGNEPDLVICKELEKQFASKIEIVKKAVMEMRKACADVLYRLLYSQETVEQIADARGVGLQTLRTEVSRCKNELREQLYTKHNFNQDGLWL